MPQATPPVLTDVALDAPGAAASAALLRWLEGLELNTLFARAVLAREAPGRVRVDSAGSPSLLYVLHGYGMSLLLGAGDGASVSDRHLLEVLRARRATAEWLQLWPRPLAARFAAISASPAGAAAAAVAPHTRVNFEFSAAAYRSRRRRHPEPAPPILPVDRALFAMTGSVVPRLFWSDAESFLRRGAGFAVMIDGAPAALAFSSFVTRTRLELGIETVAHHRGRGLAALACQALIDHCLAHGLEPVWACRLENTASYRLATSLGFFPVRQLPYFRLPPAPALEPMPT